MKKSERIITKCFVEIFDSPVENFNNIFLATLAKDLLIKATFCGMQIVYV